MERLLQMAKKVCEKAEVYSISYSDNLVKFDNAKLHDVESKLQSGVSLRIIQDGKLGFAYTRNLVNREEILQNALDSLGGGVAADYDFPQTKELPHLDTYDSSVERLSSSEMLQECARVCERLKSQTDGEILVISYTHVENAHLMNSEGTSVSFQGSEYGMFGDLIYPGSGVGIWRSFQNQGFGKMPQDLVNEMIDLYTTSSRVVEPQGGKMKVLFMPNSMIALIWRILSGTCSKSIYEGISPLTDKIGEKIFDEKISIYDDPLDDERSGARAFDDEGVACQPLTIVEKGVLKNFYYDLNYAKKLNTKSSGHGYRTIIGFGTTDPIMQKPNPALTHLRIKPGNKSFAQLLKSMDRGIIIEGGLGPHSGNIPNGDYSVGVSPGLYVENGQIIGRVKDAMVSGNVYETLKHVIDIGNTLYPSFMGAWVPAILCDNVSVVTKE